MKWRFPDWLTKSLDDPEMPMRLFLVFLLIFCPTHGRIVDLIKVEVVALAAVGVLVPWLVRRWEYWGLFTALFAVNLVYSFEHSANHYFLTLYTCMALAVTTYVQGRGETPRINLPRALLIITFGFATLHKFLSEYFTSGRLLASYFLKGRTLQRPLELVYEGFPETIQAYRAQLDYISGHASVAATSVPITVPTPHFDTLCTWLALSIGIAELIVFGMLAWNKTFYSKWFPYVLVSFVWGTYLFRNELTFFSLLCILGLMGLTQAGRLSRFLLAGSAALLLALSLNEIYLRL
jgi:hypothetical protein